MPAETTPEGLAEGLERIARVGFGYDITDRDRTLLRSAARALARPAESAGWRCFHCDETFTTEEAARLHFGADEGAQPGCVEKLKGGDLGLLARVRDVEKQLLPYLSETDAVSVFVFGLMADHRQALRRAEEEGFNRGVQDVKACPEAVGLVPAPPSAAPSPAEPAPADAVARAARVLLEAEEGAFTEALWQAAEDYSLTSDMVRDIVWQVLVALAAPPAQDGEGQR